MKFLFLFLIILSKGHAATEIIKFEGLNFPTPEGFTREIKSKYDVIEKKLTFKSDNTIELEAYVLGNNKKEIVKIFEYNGLEKSPSFNKKYVKYINWGVPLVFTAYGALFWDWGQVNGFRTRNEGWFGGDTYAGGTDKLAHMYSHFLINRLSYNFYLNNGLSRKEALQQSFILASSVGLLIEVGDGLSSYGFSFQDLISDFVGIGFGHLLNSNVYLDELIGFQFWWWNNTSSPEHRGAKFKDPIDDYNNQKYIFNIRFAAIPALRDFKVTRYINFDIGYLSRGFKGDGPRLETKREIFTGFSINMSQLIVDFFPKSDYAFYTSSLFRYYQPPATGFTATDWEDRD